MLLNDLSAYAAEMFAAKSDVSAFSEAELLRMDSKEYAVGGKDFRVSVLETTSPATVFARKDALMSAMPQVAQEDDADQAQEIQVSAGDRVGQHDAERGQGDGRDDRQPRSSR